MYKHPRFISEVPSTSEAQIGEIRLTDYLLEHPAVSLMHTMQGPSMINLGIFHGDTLIIEKGRVPIEGDIVMAVIDGEYRIREFRYFKGSISLCSGNINYGDLLPDESLQILGVVSASFRKYR